MSISCQVQINSFVSGCSLSLNSRMYTGTSGRSASANAITRFGATGLYISSPVAVALTIITNSRHPMTLAANLGIMAHSPDASTALINSSPVSLPSVWSTTGGLSYNTLSCLVTDRNMFDDRSGVPHAACRLGSTCNATACSRSSSQRPISMRIRRPVCSQRRASSAVGAVGGCGVVRDRLNIIYPASF